MMRNGRFLLFDDEVYPRVAAEAAAGGGVRLGAWYSSLWAEMEAHRRYRRNRKPSPLEVRRTILDAMEKRLEEEYADNLFLTLSV